MNTFLITFGIFSFISTIFVLYLYLSDSRSESKVAFEVWFYLETISFFLSIPISFILLFFRIMDKILN